MDTLRIDRPHVNPTRKPARSVSLLLPIGEQSPGVVRLAVGKAFTDYFVNRRPADWGLGFRMEKLPLHGEESYAVLIDPDGGRHQCDCPGFQHHAHCKHTDGLLALPVWHLLTDERFRAKMDMRDRYFDGSATEAELDAALKAADGVPNRLWLDAWDSVPPRRRVRILHDLFGNPFRPVAVDPSWLTPDVAALARTIYDDRAFHRMPDLADALARAGCQNNDILRHCRQPGDHVRGCWVVDGILGRE